MSDDLIQDAIDTAIEDLDRETLLAYVWYQDLLIKMLVKRLDQARFAASTNAETIKGMQRMDS